jgi:hypothetical protein
VVIAAEEVGQDLDRLGGSSRNKTWPVPGMTRNAALASLRERPVRREGPLRTARALPEDRLGPTGR